MTDFFTYESKSGLPVIQQIWILEIIEENVFVMESFWVEIVDFLRDIEYVRDFIFLELVWIRRIPFWSKIEKIKNFRGAFHFA